MNGELCEKIIHARGLRQGDPLSPLLFILAIDRLQRIIEAVVNVGLLWPVLPKAARVCCSLYADDAGFFVNPDASKLQVLSNILDFLVNAVAQK